MKPESKESLIYIIASTLIIITFIIGNIIGFSVMSDQPTVDDKILKAFDKDDKVRVIISKDDTQRKIFSAKDKDLDDAITNKNVEIIKKNKKNNFAVAEITREELENLRRDGNFKHIMLDEPIKIMLSESTQIIESDKVNTYELNKQPIRGEGESVCVIDTGINYAHPSLGDCTSEEYLMGNCNKVIGGLNLINTSTLDIMDDQGHGSHVAGIIAGDGTIIGVAPKAKLVAVKALDKDGGGYLSDLINGIEWCTEHKEEYNISVISISAGSLDPYTDICDSSYEYSASIITAAINKNISVIVATGNNGYYNGISYPACLSEAIPVASIDKNKVYATSANRGLNFPNTLLAPGVNIISAHLGDNNAQMSGTSMATPHVSGGFALMHQANKLVNNKTMTHNDVKTLLMNTSENLYDAETNLEFPLIQLMNSTSILDTTKPVIDVYLNESQIIKNTTKINLTWITSSGKNHTSLLEIKNSDNDTILNNTQTTGDIIIDDETLLTQENKTILGKYEIIITSENANGISNSSNIFYYKQEPLFNLTIQNMTREMNITGNYNISIQSIDSYNITIRLNNETINATHAQNITLTEGENNITAKQSETDKYITKEITQILNLTNPAPIILNTTPSVFNLSIYENETVFFNQTSENPIDGNLTIYWSETNNNNQTQIINETYLFDAKNKTDATIKLIVENEYKNTSINWTIIVNYLPLIEINISPQEPNITLEFNETQIFVFEFEDHYNRTINTTWTLNNETSNQTNNETSLFDATNYNNGTYELNVSATNNKTITNNSWIITIMPEPYLILKNNITNKNINLHDNLIIDTNNYFEYYLQGATPNYSLSNNNITYDVTNSTITINSETELDETTKIIANYTNKTITSNEFNIKITEPEIEPEPEATTESTTSSTSMSTSSFAPISESEHENESELNESYNMTQNETKDSATQNETKIKVKHKEKNEYDKNATIKEITQYEIINTPIKEFNKTIYKAYEIKTNTTNATIEFEVELDWFETKNMTPAQISLYRYTDEWVELETQLIHKIEHIITYEAKTPGFSYFLIGEKTQKEPQTEQPTPIKNNNKNPLYLIAVLISTIIIITIIIKNKLHHKKDDTN